MSKPNPVMTAEQKAEWRRLEDDLERASAASRRALEAFIDHFDCELQACEACGNVFDLEDCHMGEDGWFCKGCVHELEDSAP